MRFADGVKSEEKGRILRREICTAGTLQEGECEGDADCHGYLKTNRAMTSFLRGVRPDGASGIEGNGKKDGLPKQPIF